MKKNLNSHVENVSDFEQQPLQVSRRRFLTGAGAVLSVPLLAGLWA